MLTVRGADNQIPVKVNHLDEFISLLKAKNISYRFSGSMTGYFVYEFQSDKDKSKAIKLRDTIYKTNSLCVKCNEKKD